MSADANRVTEYRYNAEGKLKELIVRDSETGDQVTRWHYGTTLAESGVASNSLLRAKVYPESDDAGPADDGPDTVYDRVEYRYNRLGEVIGQKDQTGTEHAYEYNLLGRLVEDRVTELGIGIDGAVRRVAQSYNRMGRLESVSSWSEAEVGSGSVVNQVVFRYNGFGQLAEEYQSHDGEVDTESTPAVLYTYADGSARHIRRLSTVYPDGREIARYYGAAGSADDKLGRVYELRDAGDGGAALVRYTRRGLSATMRIEYPQCGASSPLEMTYIKQAGEPDGPAGDQYTGQDVFNRIIDIRWLREGTETHVDRIQYGFDRAGNRLWRKNVVAASDWDELYTYDGLYQLPERQRGTLNSGRTALTGTPLDDEQFTYDPTGNWDGYLTQADGSTTLNQSRTHNQASEITEIDGSASTVSYNLAGNMILMPKMGDWGAGQTVSWDAWNRLVKISEDATVVGRYGYDGLARRVWKESSESGSEVTRRHYYYSDQWQVLEERVDSATSAERQFVWGLRYIDDLILRDCDSYIPSRLYATHDQWHVIATADDAGDATERYAYRAFGDTQVLTPDFTPRSESISGWEITYGAYRYDQEAKLYYVRSRYLHPALGRWVSRDPTYANDGINLLSDVDGSIVNPPSYFGAPDFIDGADRPALAIPTGNLSDGKARMQIYNYARNNSVNFADPTGLDICDPAKPTCNETQTAAIIAGMNDICQRYNNGEMADCCLKLSRLGYRPPYIENILINIRDRCKDRKHFRYSCVDQSNDDYCKTRRGEKADASTNTQSGCITICSDSFKHPDKQTIACVLAHELVHAAGEEGEALPIQMAMCLGCPETKMHL